MIKFPRPNTIGLIQTNDKVFDISFVWLGKNPPEQQDQSTLPRWMKKLGG